MVDECDENKQKNLPSNTAEPVEKGKVEESQKLGIDETRDNHTKSLSSLPSNTAEPVEKGGVDGAQVKVKEQTNSNNIENSYDKVKQKSSNKSNHTKNGNTKSNKIIKIIQINKGKSKLLNVDKELLETIVENRADIAIISEANHDNNDGESTRSINNTFSDYNVETKTSLGASISRIIIIIKKNINYVRVKELESDINSSVIIKLIQSTRKNTFIIGLYRQWKSFGNH